MTSKLKEGESCEGCGGKIISRLCTCGKAHPYWNKTAHTVTEYVRISYTVNIPDDITDIEAQEEYVCENQPPRSQWCESVEERVIFPDDGS